MRRWSSTFWSGQVGSMVWHFRTWSPVWISPHNQALDLQIPHFTMLAAYLPTPDLSWLSCTHALLGRLHPDGLVVHWVMYGACWSGTSSGHCILDKGLWDMRWEGASLIWRILWRKWSTPWALSWVFMQIWSLHSCGHGVPEKNGSCDTGVLRRHPKASFIASFKRISILWAWALCMQAVAQYSTGEEASSRTEVLSTPNKASHLVPAKHLMRATQEDTLFFNLVR